MMDWMDSTIGVHVVKLQICREMTQCDSVDEGGLSQSTFVHTTHTKMLLALPWGEVNMKASSDNTDIKQTEHSHYVTPQGAGASIKLYCPWVI